jgi:hypothetical protein
MLFTWKGQQRHEVYPVRYNAFTDPNANQSQFQGNYPKTNFTTKEVVNCGNGKTEIVTSTSIPVCNRRFTRPLKIIRKRLLSAPVQQGVNKPTIQEAQNPIYTSLSVECLQNTVQVPFDTNSICYGIERPNCQGGSNHIQRSASTLIDKKYCTSNREYLQRKTKTYDQNLSKGKPLGNNQFQSATGVEQNCIIYKRSNPSFGTQGGVTAATRTSQLRDQTMRAHCNPICLPSRKDEIRQCAVVRQDRAYLRPMTC